MAEPYTPPTRTVRNIYVRTLGDELTTPRAVLGAEFDRWLASEHATTLRMAADALEGRLGTPGAPRDLWEFRRWLRTQADRIERRTDSD